MKVYLVTIDCAAQNIPVKVFADQGDATNFIAHGVSLGGDAKIDAESAIILEKDLCYGQQLWGDWS